MNSREDMYKVKVTAAANLRNLGAQDAEQKRFVEKMVDEKCAGLALESNGAVKRLQDELTEARVKKDGNEESGRITFSREQLDGVPRGVISGYSQCTEDDEVLYEVTFREPDIIPLFKYANDSETREVAHYASEILGYRPSSS